MVGCEVYGPLWVVLKLSGPLWVVLGRSCGLCWRSWAALRAYVGGLGRSWGLCWRSLVALGRKVTETQAGTRVKAEKWPKPERAQSAGPPEASEASEAPGASTHFFCRYVFTV